MKYHVIALLMALPLMAKDPLHFSIVIASYNNEAFAHENITSALSQTYPHYHVYYINDCSTDRTLATVRKTIRKSGKSDRVTIINNLERQGAMANFAQVIGNDVPSDSIVVLLDGDDQLSCSSVLTYLSEDYESRDIWLTYGQYQELKSHSQGFCCPMPGRVVEENGFRSWSHGPSHLKTFYAWLFQLIEIDDFIKDGDFYPMSSDLAMMLPMIEMARDHFAFIPKILYLYNDANPRSDHLIDKDLQRDIDLYIRSLPSYTPLTRRPE